MATVTKCDHCGNDDGTARECTFHDTRELRMNGTQTADQNGDLCEACVDKILAFFSPRVPRKRKSRKGVGDAN